MSGGTHLELEERERLAEGREAQPAGDCLLHLLRCRLEQPKQISARDCR